MNNALLAMLMIAWTVAAYLTAFTIHKRYRKVYTAPIILGTPLIIVPMIFFHIPYADYAVGGEQLSRLLGPAVVSLAYPLYLQRAVLKKYVWPIITGTFVGAIVGIGSGILLTKWLGFEKEVIYSLTPKSVTTPIAMEVSSSLGGISSLAAIFVMIAGIGGMVISLTIFKWFRINEPVARGVGVGSASHAVGTSAALQWSQLEGSVSTIAMILSAIFVSILTPFIVPLIYG